MSSDPSKDEVKGEVPEATAVVVPPNYGQAGGQAAAAPSSGGMLGQLGNALVPSSGPAQAVAPIPVGYGANVVQQPGVQAMSADAPPQQGDFSFLADKTRFYMKQRKELLEGLANMVGIDVLEFANKYDIYDASTGLPMLYVQEESNCLCRACCAPHHEAKLHVFDVRDGGNIPIATIQKPFKCNCCIISEICSQSQETQTRTGQVLGSAKQPLPCGGCFVPTVDVMDAEGNDYMTLQGPTCILGGAIELCVDQEFQILDKNKAPHGRLVHMKPGSSGDGVSEVLTDADRFLLEINSGIDAGKTLNLLGTLLLLDYLFYEGGPPCGFENGAIKINCFNLYCGGCICPCHFTLGGGENQ